MCVCLCAYDVCVCACEYTLAYTYTGLHFLMISLDDLFVKSSILNVMYNLYVSVQ